MFDVWLIINVILWYAAIDRMNLNIKSQKITNGLFILTGVNLIGSLFAPILALLACGNIVVLKIWLMYKK